MESSVKRVADKSRAPTTWDGGLEGNPPTDIKRSWEKQHVMTLHDTASYGETVGHYLLGNKAPSHVERLSWAIELLILFEDTYRSKELFFSSLQLSRQNKIYWSWCQRFSTDQSTLGYTPQTTTLHFQKSGILPTFPTPLSKMVGVPSLPCLPQQVDIRLCTEYWHWIE